MTSLALLVRKFDWLLVIIILVFGIFSLLTFQGIGPRSEQIMEKHLIFLIAGIGVMIAVAFFDCRVFKNYSFPPLFIYFLAILLLLPAFFSQSIRGINAWITIFDTYQFQPSEFAKLAVLILLAKYFAVKHVEIYRPRYIIASGVYAGIPAFLTFLQPDFGSMTIFLVLWLALLFFSGVQRRHLFIIFMVGVMGAAAAWLFVFQPYQKNRIMAFINPYADARGIGYNTIQAQTTIGSGGLLGTMFDKDKKNLAVLAPEPYTDFTFSAFSQKFGFLGITVLLGLFGLLFYRLGALALRVSSNFPKLFIVGFMVIMFTHLVINIGMNLGLLPITGIPLSLLSYGGSHFMTLMVGFGLIQSIKIRS